MKLFNTIAIWDVYCVAETGEEARKALLNFIAHGDECTPSECVATETSREVAIRNAWREQRPIVASDVSDDDFKKLEGRTTIQIFERIYTKRG